MTAYPSPPPAGGAREAATVRAHVGQGALDLVRQSLGALLTSSLTVEGGRAVFYLEESVVPATSPLGLRDGCLGPDTTPCASPTARSRVSVDVAALERALSVTWADTSAGGPGLRFELTQLDLYPDLVVFTDLSPAGLGSGAACRLHGDGGAAPLHVDELAFTLSLAVVPGASGPRLATSVDPAFTRVTLGRALALQLDPCGDAGDVVCADPLCAADPQTCATICGFLSLFVSSADLLAGVVTPVIEQLAPVLAYAAASAMAPLLAAVPLEVATQVSLAGAVAPAAPPLIVGFTAAPPLEVRGTGAAAALDLALDAGVTVALPAGVDSLACGQAGEPPDTSLPAGPGPVHGATIDVPDASGALHPQLYDLAVAVSQRLFTQLAWSTYQGGLLCLDLDGASLGGPTSGSMSLTAGLLESLAPGLTGLAPPESPVLLVVAPTTPPRLSLASADAPRAALSLSLLGLTLDLYLLVDDAYSRLARLGLDVDASLALEPGPGATLELVVDAMHVANVVEQYNELAPGADLPALVTLGADLALSSLLGGGQAFALDLGAAASATLGVTVSPRVLTVRTAVDASGEPWLDTYLLLCGPADAASPARPACIAAPSARATQVVAPATIPSSAGIVALSVASDAPDAAWQASVDGGLWSSYAPAPAGILEVTSPRLRLPGRHDLAVRARSRASPGTRGPTATVSVEAVAASPSNTVARSPPTAPSGCSAAGPGLAIVITTAPTLLRRRRRRPGASLSRSRS